MRFGELMASVGRDNNFNLIRIVAALCVLVSHAYALTTGDPRSEPFAVAPGLSLGRMAVDVFFVTSGFLICGSLISRGDIVQFICSRVMRIYPGLIVALLLTAMLLGPMMTTSSVAEYFSSSSPWLYVVKTGVIIFGPQEGIIGVFASNPYPSAVNGSLWTLRFEILMYVLIFFAWLICSWIRSSANFLRVVVLLSALAALIFYWCALFFDFNFQKIWLDLLKLFALFFTGASVKLYSDKISLNDWAAAGIFLILIFSGLNNLAFAIIWPLALPYIVFYLAYRFRGFVSSYNKIGDYSYGVYIYAFPVQQTVAAVLPAVSVFEMIFWSFIGTMPLAIFSWHLIESRALHSIPTVVSFIKGLSRARIT